jgi:DNA-binding Lrp family transcriptional regulator
MIENLDKTYLNQKKEVITCMNLPQRKIKTDLKDLKILYELDINARQSNSSIGKKVGLSKDFVNYRIKNMEKNGLIKGYYTVLDVSKLGYLNFRIFIRLKKMTPQKEKEIIDYLINEPFVGWLVSVEGAWDINMFIWAKNVYEMREIWHKFMQKYVDHVSDKWISIITEMVQYSKAYILDLKRDDTKMEIVRGGPLKADIDEIDWKILNLIAPNARISLLDIGQKLDISAKVISYRIKKLIDMGVILGYKALIDLELLGIEYYKVHLKLSDFNKEKELLTYTRYHPNIIIVDQNVGGFDFEIELHVKSNEHLHEIIDDIKIKFSDVVESYEILRYYKEYKWVFMPVKNILTKAVEPLENQNENIVLVEKQV